MIKIELYRDADFAGLLALMKCWGNDYSFTREQIRTTLDTVLSDPGSEILVALENGQVIGYAQTVQCCHLGFDPFCEVAQLLVADSHRSIGVGSMIMKKIEERAAERGIFTVKLHSQVHRSRAHVFYERLDYRYVKVSKFYEKKISRD